MTYTALTIGPIYKTLQSVKSAKAIWGASYMFSYLMKEIIKESKVLNINVILPYFDADLLNKENQKRLKTQAGLFPDRLIIRGEVNLQPAIEKVIGNFGGEVFEDIKNESSLKKEITEQKVIEYLKNYLNLYWLQVKFDEDDLKKKGSNVIFEISKMLDALELSRIRIPNAERDYLVTFFEKYTMGYNFLIKEEFPDKPFLSTAEIACAEFRDDHDYIVNDLNKIINKVDENDQKKYYLKIKEIFKNRFHTYHKYFAIVHADGDNIGKLIKEISGDGLLLAKFSENLLNFSKEAVKKIKDYNAIPIYAGGDDLLFFAPVAHSKEESNGDIIIEKTILDIIYEIDKLFDDYFTYYNKEGINFEKIISEMDEPISMSYGVSVSYYKFPLSEALTESRNRLFEDAKNSPGKNAVSFRILKHSGQQFSAVFNKDETSYRTFNKLVNEHLDNENYIHSIAHKFKPQNSVLYSIGTEKDEDLRNKMFDNFFRNNFDESIHKKSENELTDFLKNVKQLFKEIYSKNKLELSKEDKLFLEGKYFNKTERNLKNEEKIEAKHKNNFDKIYASLRFIDFIINREDRDE